MSLLLAESRFWADRELWPGTHCRRCFIVTDTADSWARDCWKAGLETLGSDVKFILPVELKEALVELSLRCEELQPRQKEIRQFGMHHLESYLVDARSAEVLKEGRELLAMLSGVALKGVRIVIMCDDKNAEWIRKLVGTRVLVHGVVSAPMDQRFRYLCGTE